MANSNVQTHPPSENKTLWAWLIGTFFGAGLLKPGPGTYGSISAVLLWYAAGHLIALIAIPADWQHAALSLILFRLFDILKPPPIRQLERLPAGTGIMLDDVAAGLFALAVAQLLHIWF